LQSTNHSIGVICITRNITHSFHTEVFSPWQNRADIADIATTGKTGYRPSADACLWTAADTDVISADADAKISASAHLCEWCLL